MVSVEVMNNTLTTNYDVNDLFTMINGTYKFLSFHIDFNVQYDINIEMVFKQGVNHYMSERILIESTDQFSQYLVTAPRFTYGVLNHYKGQYTDVHFVLKHIGSFPA